MKGQLIGHYKILEKLGAGGMGEVWLAEDTRLDRKVALKFLPFHAAQDENEKARFIQEAKVAACLSHSNIAQVFEIGEEAGRLFIVMEYVKGGSLRDHLEHASGRALALDTVLHWAQQAAEGLAEAHKSGVIHRDIKPDNLMLSESGQLKITDFGLARLETATRLTAAGATLGTVNYMSPEQVTGKEVDHRADIFSLGATIFELLTGHRAFEGTEPNSTYFAILNDQTEPISRYRRDMPEGLEQIITKMLDKDPALRYQSALDVVSDLRRLEKIESQVSMPTKAARYFWERIVVVPGSYWLSILLLALVLQLQTSPNIGIYRKVAQDTFLRDLVRREEHISPLIRIADNLVIDRDHLLTRFGDLLEAGSVDVHLAAAAIAVYPEQVDGYLVAALGFAPTDAGLHALRAEFRFHRFEIRDDLAYQHALRSVQLDPDNGAYLLLAAIGAAASGDTIAADNMLRNAVQVDDFSIGWNRYYSSLYRTLVAVDCLHPTWHHRLPWRFFEYFRQFSLAYLGGRDTRGLQRPSDWLLSWTEPDAELKSERAEIIEALGNRLLMDRSLPVGGLRAAVDLINLGARLQYNNSHEDEIRSGMLWRSQQANNLIDWISLYDRDERRQFNSMMTTSRRAYQLYLWSWYLLLWSLLFTFVFRRIRSSSGLGGLEFTHVQRTGEWELSLIWLFGTWVPFLFIKTPWAPVEMIAQCLVMGFAITYLFQLSFRGSIWHQRKSGIQKGFEQSTSRWLFFHSFLARILNQPSYSRAIVGFLCLLAIVWVLPEFIIRRIHPEYLEWDFDLVILYGQVLLSLLVFPILLRNAYRKNESAGMGHLTAWLVLFSATLLCITTCMMWLWSQPYSERLLTIMHSSEPYFFSGTLFP